MRGGGGFFPFPDKTRWKLTCGPRLTDLESPGAGHLAGPVVSGPPLRARLSERTFLY